MTDCLILATSALSADQTCDIAGTCTADEAVFDRLKTIEVAIPKGANAFGKPEDAPEDCMDRHGSCKSWADQGECDINPGLYTPLQ